MGIENAISEPIRHFESAQTSIHLLEHYTALSTHHRTMLVGFALAYFGVTQVLLLTDPNSFKGLAGQQPLALIISGGLLVSFILCAALHHTCHFVSSAAVKASLLAELHFRHLPPSKSDLDIFQSWINETAEYARQSLAIRSFSVAILGTIFSVLNIINAYIFTQTCMSIIDKQSITSLVTLGAFLALQAIAVSCYGVTLVRHFVYFRRAKRDLVVVLRSTSRAEVEQRAQEDLKGSKSRFPGRA